VAGDAGEFGAAVDAFAAGGVAGGERLAGEGLEFGGGELHVGEREAGGLHEGLNEVLVLAALAGGAEAGAGDLDGEFGFGNFEREAAAGAADRKEFAPECGGFGLNRGGGEDGHDIRHRVHEIGAGEGDDGFAAEGGCGGFAGEAAELGDDGSAREFAK